MTAQSLLVPQALPKRDSSQPISAREGRVYAIAVELDAEALEAHFGGPCESAHDHIYAVLVGHGFVPLWGHIYIGKQTTNAVTCVMAVMDLARSLPWFEASVRDIRMLRIEEFSDLMPAVQQAARDAMAPQPGDTVAFPQ